MNIEKYTCRSCGYKEYVGCNQIIESEDVTAHYCLKPAKYYYRWSDRRTTACANHEDHVIKNYEGDHEGDKTGLWRYETKHGPQERII